jgi:N-acetylglutamate synthase-like GNAT family acetyltransferase
MILFRAGAALARLYSLAVAPGHAGRGYGRALLTAAEKPPQWSMIASCSGSKCAKATMPR